MCVYIDNSAISATNLKSIVNSLENKYRFKLKGTELILFNLGCDFFHDSNVFLCFTPQNYIDKIFHTYMNMFGGVKTTQVCHTLLEQGDHTDLETSEMLDNQDTQKYHFLIGSLQWYIYLGIFDICTHVMKMYSFRYAPRQGHIDRLKKIY